MRRANVREPPCPVGRVVGENRRKTEKQTVAGGGGRARAIGPTGTVTAATLFQVSASLRARTQRAHDRRREMTVDND